jgi:hypothetical protein
MYEGFTNNEQDGGVNFMDDLALRKFELGELQ